MERFGRYVLLERRATGGMGEVFRASPVDGPFQLLAIKRALPHAADDKALAQAMLDEARIAARLSHPHILSVLDAGDVAGRFYLCLPWVEGHNLHEVVMAARRSGVAVPPPVVAHVGMAMLDALEHAHATRDTSGESMGIVHRDVSPQNIMMGFDGRVALTDFGIARATVRAARTTTGVIKGKVAYLAPEQLRGGPVDGRVDLYALAVVLWELLAGEPMRDAQSEPELLGQVLRGDVKPLPQHAREAAPAAADVLERALHADVTGRFPDAASFRAAWTRAMPQPAGPGDVAAFMRTLFPDEAAPAAGAEQAWRNKLEAWRKESQRGGQGGGHTVWLAGVLAGACAWLAVRWLAPAPVEPAPVAPPAVVEPRLAALPVPPTPNEVPDAGLPRAAADAGPRPVPRTAARKPVQKPNPPPPEEPAPAPDMTPGHVSLMSRPWGRIIVDGKDTGKFTPTVGLMLPPGRHTIRLVNDEVKMQDEFELLVEPGRTVKATRTLR